MEQPSVQDILQNYVMSRPPNQVAEMLMDEEAQRQDLLLDEGGSSGPKMIENQETPMLAIQAEGSSTTGFMLTSVDQSKYIQEE